MSRGARRLQLGGAFECVRGHAAPVTRNPYHLDHSLQASHEMAAVTLRRQDPVPVLARLMEAVRSRHSRKKSHTVVERTVAVKPGLSPPVKGAHGNGGQEKEVDAVLRQRPQEHHQRECSHTEHHGVYVPPRGAGYRTEV